MKHVDLLVIGAGPAGLSTALTAHGFGFSVLVVDETPQPGGQIYRNLQANPLQDITRILGDDYVAGKPLLDRFIQSGIDYLPRTRVWQIGDDHVAYLSCASTNPPPEPVKARFVVLATGAQERPFPLPGWTTPGVMTVGAAQILLKTAGLLPPRDVVLIGSGPLLYQFAWQVYQAGGRVQTIVDARGPITPSRLLRHLPGALRSPALLWRGLNLLAALRRHKVRHIKRAEAIRLIGEHKVDRVRFVADGKEHSIDTSSVLLHAGLIPETSFSSAFGIEHDWNHEQQAWQTHRNEWQESTHPGVFIAGDGGRIEGAEAAQFSGQIAALEIARQSGKISEHERNQQARPTLQLLQKKQAPRPFLEALYPPPKACFSPPDEAIVCRCENVTAGTIRRAAQLGAPGPNQIKTLTRTGMGLCQGRMCGCVTAAIAAEVAGVDIAQVDMPRGRYPIKPVTLEEIALSFSTEPNT